METQTRSENRWASVEPEEPAVGVALTCEAGGSEANAHNDHYAP